MRKNKIPWLLVCLLIVPMSVARGQVPSQPEPEQVIHEEPTNVLESTDPVYERRGADLPKFVVVRKFFKVVNVCRSTGLGAYGRMLRDLDIEKGSSAEQLLLEATEEALKRVHTVDLTDPYLRKDDAELMRVQLEALRHRVHRMRGLYYGLLEDLENLGVSADRVEAVVETMRDGIAMFSTPTPDYEVFEIMDEFEAKPGPAHPRLGVR